MNITLGSGVGGHASKNQGSPFERHRVLEDSIKQKRFGLTVYKDDHQEQVACSYVAQVFRFLPP